jgi:hypothetical protein
MVVTLSSLYGQYTQICWREVQHKERILIEKAWTVIHFEDKGGGTERILIFMLESKLRRE